MKAALRFLDLIRPSAIGTSIYSITIVCLLSARAGQKLTTGRHRGFQRADARKTFSNVAAKSSEIRKRRPSRSALESARPKAAAKPR